MMDSSAATPILTAQQAWDELMIYKYRYYRKYAAAYSGNRTELAGTASRGTFWKRRGKCRLHVPIAADIAATSSDLLFSEEPRFMCVHENTEENENPQQKRLDALIESNNIHSKLNEAAESSAALGDVYLKLGWRQNDMDHPTIQIVQPDNAWPQYILGELQCVHFFSILKRDFEKECVTRIYERYERGKIVMSAFIGTEEALGTEHPELITQLGFEDTIIPPVQDMLAVHIPNMRPNREWRDLELGRSDSDGLRDLMDALDEAYSSWMRDIRLAKARLIVPMEYVRRLDVGTLPDNKYTYEFDEDVETLVALDINTDHATGNPITPSQFSIRATEHEQTCTALIQEIVSKAGYSPQTFGLQISGMAQSGTALHIREKKSYNTRGKKQTYWKAPLERIMTAMVHLDAALYPKAGSHADDTVTVHFSDSMANDLTTIAAAIEMLDRASALSTQIKVQMQHPDWTQKQVNDEVERVKEEYDKNVDQPIPEIGDFEMLRRQPEKNQQEGEASE